MALKKPPLTFTWYLTSLKLLDLNSVQAGPHKAGEFIVRIGHPYASIQWRKFNTLEEAHAEKNRIVNLWEEAQDYELRLKGGED